MSTASYVEMNGIRLTEFDKSRRVESQRALVFDDDKCRYDIIFGADFLTTIGISLDYSTGVVNWMGTEVTMRGPNLMTDDDYFHMLDAMFIQQDDEFLGEAWAADIAEAKYEKVDIADVVRQCSHLESSQQNDYRSLLSKFTKLFDGTFRVVTSQESAHRTRGRSKTSSCPTLSCGQSPQGHFQKGIGASDKNQCVLPWPPNLCR